MRSIDCQRRWRISSVFVAGLVFAFGGCGPGPSPRAPAAKAPVPTNVSPALAKVLKAATEGSEADRCVALERLKGRWAPRRTVPEGFSDLPVPAVPLVSPPVPDGDIEAIATVLQSALRDPSPEIRKVAALCLCSAPRMSPAVEGAIAAGLSSEDETVLWYVMQIDKDRLPDPGPYVPNLIRHLQSTDFTPRYAATTLIEHFGKRFAPYTGAIADALPTIPEENRGSVLLSLDETGLPESTAEKLAKAVAKESPATQAAAFIALIQQPDVAARLLREHPGMSGALMEFDNRWCILLYSTAPEHRELRSLLSALPRQSPANLALIGSPDAIPELKRQWEAASKHEKTYFLACIRACGGELGEVVHLSEEVPVRFKPKSAWPDTDDSRRSDDLGHGDGFTPILVTGELKFADEGHPSQVTFSRVNDGMLLGESRNDPLPLKYEPSTGRFVLRTTVFAAYNSGKASEPGPYQTGSAQVRIESNDGAPLVIQFFDEMPHVVIELKRR